MLNDFTKKNMICWCKKRKVSLSCVRKLLHLGHLKKGKIDHSVTVKMDEKQIIDGCVSLVRESGRPFKILDDKGFSMILDPLLEGLGWSLTISAENIVPKINLAAQKMRDKLKNEMKNRLICLKVDCAKRLDGQFWELMRSMSMMVKLFSVHCQLTN